MSTKYIGIKKVKKEIDDGAYVKLLFDDKSETTMKKTLYDKVAMDEQRTGTGTETVTDVVVGYFASRVLAEMAMEDLEYYMVDHVALRLRTFAHNAREEAIARAFECSGAENIPLQKIV